MFKCIFEIEGKMVTYDANLPTPNVNHFLDSICSSPCSMSLANPESPSQIPVDNKLFDFIT